MDEYLSLLMARLRSERLKVARETRAALRRELGGAASAHRRRRPVDRNAEHRYNGSEGERS